MTYTKEFLISELQRFHRENGRVPRRIDMQPKFGYPSYQAYTTHFITFNNGLEAAKLKVNQIRYKLNGTEICVYCEKRTNEILGHAGWYYYDNIRYYNKCGRLSRIYDCKKGKLDKKALQVKELFHKVMTI